MLGVQRGLSRIFAVPALGGLGLPDGATVPSQLGVQALAVVVVSLWTAALSFVILKAAGYRPPKKVATAAAVPALVPAKEATP